MNPEVWNKAIEVIDKAEKSNTDLSKIMKVSDPSNVKKSRALLNGRANLTMEDLAAIEKAIDFIGQDGSGQVGERTMKSAGWLTDKYGKFRR